jgi:hypothetical protein
MTFLGPFTFILELPPPTTTHLALPSLEMRIRGAVFFLLCTHQPLHYPLPCSKHDDTLVVRSMADNYL